MTSYDYDLFTIGAGSGGVRASRFAAQLGARVAVAEDRPLGGTCVNLGCIPKKLLSYAAHYHEHFEDAAGFGWTVPTPSFSWPALIANKDREIARLNGVYEKLFTDAGVTLLRGRAKVLDPHTVAIGDQQVSARHILVATGGRPTKPELPGIEHAITSDEAFHLAELPGRVVVYGGGYIAVEFASILAGFGAEVTLVYRGAQILREFDSDLGATLAPEMAKKGVAIRLTTRITGIVRGAAGLTVSLDDGTQLAADSVLAATGRTPNTAGLGLEAAGVALEQSGAVRVDADYRSNVASILAIGDVIDRVQLTPVALAEGMYVAELLFGTRRPPINYESVATAVFSHPNVGTVGLSEAQARARGAVQIFRSRFRALRHTLSGRDEQTMMKIVVDAATDRVLGVHMVGPDAGEIIQGFAVALQCGATKSQFDTTIGIHPTSAEEFVTMRTPVTFLPGPAS